jgi:hypothetical protein
MRRSFLYYTRILVLPLFAVGMVLTGCDSGGSNAENGSNGENGPSAASYPASASYSEQVAANILSFDLGLRTGSGNIDNNSESDLDDLYTGANLSGQTLPTELSGSPNQSTYGEIATVDLSSLVSGDDLVRDDNIPGVSAPVNTNKLLTTYFEEADNNNAVIGDGIVVAQFAEKMLLGTPIYDKGAKILNRFANDNVADDQAAEEWDKAFGYFGFPKTLEPFLDYSDEANAGLAEGPARDLDGDGLDLESEYAYTWATYAIERSAKAENTNDFARRAFEALRKGREEIANDNFSNLPSRAETARDAWEDVVAVNVIHYINAVKGGLPSSGSLSDGDIDEGSWGEAKAFAWGLQFFNTELSSGQLNDLLEDIGSEPPYGDRTASEYKNDLDDALGILENAYEFNSTNVDNW